MIRLSVPKIEGGTLSVTEEEKKKDRFGGILGGKFLEHKFPNMGLNPIPPLDQC